MTLERAGRVDTVDVASMCTEGEAEGRNSCREDEGAWLDSERTTDIEVLTGTFEGVESRAWIDAGLMETGSPIGQPSELPAPSSSLSAVPNASGASKAGHVAAISARSMPARHEAVNPSACSFVFITCSQGSGVTPERFFAHEGAPTSGTRFGLIQAPAQVPVPTRSLSLF